MSWCVYTHSSSFLLQMENLTLYCNQEDVLSFIMVHVESLVLRKKKR